MKTCICYKLYYEFKQIASLLVKDGQILLLYVKNKKSIANINLLKMDKILVLVSNLIRIFEDFFFRMWGLL